MRFVIGLYIVEQLRHLAVVSLSIRQEGVPDVLFRDFIQLADLNNVSQILLAVLSHDIHRLLPFIGLEENERLLCEEPMPLEELEQTLVLEQLSLLEEPHELRFVEVDVKLDHSEVILLRDLYSHLEECVKEQVSTTVDFLSLPMVKTTAAQAYLLRAIELLHDGLDELLSSQAFDLAVQYVLRCLDCIDPQQLAKVRVNRKFNHVLVQEVKDLVVSPL